MHEIIGKCVVVGDSGVGKTCLAIVNDKYGFPSNYVPTFYSPYLSSPDDAFGGCRFVWWDTWGNFDFVDGILRNCQYEDVSLVLLCFSVVQPASYESIITRWYPEIKERCPNVPVILAGVKTDLRYDAETLDELRMSNLAPITKEEGIQLSKDINALNYLECSSKMNLGTKEIASQILRTMISLKMSDVDKKKCCLQ